MAVTPPNVPPDTIPVSVTTPEDTPVNVSLVGTDPLGGTVVSFTIVLTLPAHGTLTDLNGVPLVIGSIVPAIGNQAQVRYVPDPDFFGIDTFRFASRDNGGLNDNTPATATITITPVNDPPTTNDSSGSGVEDGPPIALTLTGADVDGTVVSFTIASLPMNGVLKDGLGNVLSVGSVVPAVGNAATVFFHADADWNGSTDFNYASKDNAGLSDATPAVGHIVVTPVNDPPTTNDSSGSGLEDGPPIPLTLTGADIDGTVVSFTINSLPLNGVLKDSNGNVLSIGSVVTATGNQATVLFYADANWNGTTTFQYASHDNEGLDDGTPATGTIVVTPVNDPPTTEDTSGSGVEDGPPIALTLTGADIDGTVVSFTINDLPANGTLRDGNGNVLSPGSVVPATGGEATVYFTPNADWNGTTTFHYASHDDEGLDDGTPATGTITVTPVNDPPETFDSSASGQEDAPSIPVTITGSDVDGTVVSFTIASLPANGVLKDGNGNVLSVGSVVTASGNAATLSFIPDANWSGDTSFQYASHDNDGLDDATPATATITVTPVNDPPETEDTSGSGVEDGPPIALVLTGDDVDGTVVSFTINDLPANGTLRDGNGNVLSVGSVVTATGEAATVFFTPNANWSGDTSFHYASHDNDGLDDGTPALATITVMGVNDPPTTNDTSGSGVEDGPPIAIALSGADIDGTVASFTINSLPANGVLKDGNGNVLSAGSVVTATGNGATVFFVPNANWNGSTDFEYSSKDNEGLIDLTPALATIVVTPVNDAPETANSFGSGQQNTPIFITITGSDVDGTVTSFTITTLPPNGVLKDSGGNVLSVGSVVTASGNAATLTFVPNASFFGSVDFNYASKDNLGASDATPATGTIEVVRSQNQGTQPPETLNTSGSGVEDGPPIALTLRGTDSDGAVVSFRLNDLPANGVLKDANGNVLTTASVITATGNQSTVFFTPNANWNGSTTFHYSSKDNTGNIDATPATGTITVTPVNDGPESYDVCVEMNACQDRVAVTLRGTDPDGTVVSFKITTLPTDGVLKLANGTVITTSTVITATNGAATIYFDPNSHWDGTSTFKYAAKDNSGAQDATPATGTIKVEHENVGPQTQNSSATGVENAASIRVHITGTDSDGTVVSFKITSLPAHGVLKNAAGQVLSVGSIVTATNGAADVFFTPTAGWDGCTTFQYAAKDNDGAYDSSPATGTITVTGVNSPPETNNVSGSGAEDCPVTLVLKGTDDGSVTSFIIRDLPANGVLKTAGGTVLTEGSVVNASGNQATVYFTPNANWNGSTSFHYASKDNAGLVDATPGTATITVTAVNDRPDARNDTASTTQNNAVAIAATTLLANDTDPEGHTLTVTSVQGASNGTVTMSNGTVTFTGKAGYAGTGSFTYTISDGHGGTDTATVTVTIAASAPNPITGPGVGTPGFWSGNGAVYWDGQTDSAGTKHGGAFPMGELTYSVDKDADGDKDGNGYLLIGDWNKNGLTDNGEHTLVLSLSNAMCLVSGGASSDPLFKIGRDLVATWLNYLAGNPVGSPGAANSPAWYVNEAIDWLNQLVGSDRSIGGGVATYSVMSNGHFLNEVGNVTTWSSSWTTGINLNGVTGIQATGVDVLAGDDIHDVLDYFNNTGKIGSTVWANDRDLM